MMLLSVINGSTYLKKHNSIRKRSKRVKITKYVEQTLGKKIQTFFSAPPALKRAHGGCTRGVSPLAAGFEEVQPLPSLQHLYGFCVGIGGTNLWVWVEANAHAQLGPSCVLCVSMQCLQTW